MAVGPSVNVKKQSQPFNDRLGFVRRKKECVQDVFEERVTLCVV